MCLKKSVSPSECVADVTVDLMLGSGVRASPAHMFSLPALLAACWMCRLGKISILRLTLQPFDGNVSPTFISQRVCKLINIFPSPSLLLLQANICFLRSERGQTFSSAPYTLPAANQAAQNP